MGWLIFMWFVIFIVMVILYFVMIAFKLSKLYHDVEKGKRMILKIFQSSKKGC